MITDRDMQILSHARTLGLTTRVPPRKRAGGPVINGECATETERLAAVKRLCGEGLLAPVREPYKFDKQTTQAYDVTDAGRARLREYFGTPELTVDIARGMHASDLHRVHGDLPLAQRQLKLRRRGHGLVQAALRLLGQEHHGTSGWWLTAYATPGGALGFVNVAHGVAVLTDVQLDAELVEALTVPGQGAGVQASGAAAWTAPDAGTAKLVEDEGGVHRIKPATREEMPTAPEGWMQLLVDVRAGVGDPEAADLTQVSARVVTWGLATCYGRAGEPGHVGLGCDWDNRLPVHEWPEADPETDREMHAIGARWLDSLARKMAALADCSEEVSSALGRDRTEEPVYASAGPGAPVLPRVDIGGAIGAIGAYAWRDHAYDAKTAARSCCNGAGDTVLRDALRAARVGRISAACDVSNVVGLRYYDLIKCLLQRAIVQRLNPVAEALWSQMAPLVPSREDGWDLYMRAEPVLRGLAAELAKDLLRGVEAEASAVESKIVEVYYRNGPRAVDLPITRAA